MIWVHGVSVGEVVQAFRLVRSLKKRLPSARFLVTTTTLAGKEVALKLRSAEDRVLTFPADFVGSMRRFLQSVEPAALVLVETEIWPNLLSEVSKQRIPAFIVNGRISDKTVSKYRNVRFFLGPILNRLQAIGTQDDLMRERFVGLGADPRIVSVTGNMKFDWQPGLSDAGLLGSLQTALHPAGSFLLVAGSTHEGEEGILFEVYRRVIGRHKNFRLFIAPRHLDRMDSIERQASESGLTVIRISQFRREGRQALSTDGRIVFLLDSMGALADFYRDADAVFVGGSLVPTGGHNLAEPAYFEKPVLFGPHMENFSQMAAEFKKNSAGIEVKNAKELGARIEELIEHRDKGRLLGQKARELVSRHQGATERNVSVLLDNLSSAGVKL